MRNTDPSATCRRDRELSLVVALVSFRITSTSFRHLPVLLSCIMNMDVDEHTMPSLSSSYGTHQPNGVPDYAMDTIPMQNSDCAQGNRSQPPVSPGPASQQLQSSASLKPSPRSRPPKFRPRYVMSGHTMSISSIKFSPDGNVLASAGMFDSLSSSSSQGDGRVS